MGENFSFVNINVSIQHESVLQNGTCVFTLDDYKEYIKGTRAYEKNAIQYVEDFTSLKIPLHDLLICDLGNGSWMPIINEKLELMNFIIGVFKNEKPKGFIISIDNDNSDLNYFQLLLEINGIYDTYNINSYFFKKTNTSKMHYIVFLTGLRRDIKIHKPNINDKFIYSIISSIIKSNHNVQQAERAKLNTDLKEIKQKIKTVPLSKGSAFEEVVFETLRLSFKNAYENLDIEQQVRSVEGLTIKDFIIYNIGSENSFLNNLNNKGAELLLFEAKNYKAPLSSTDLARFKGYIVDNSHFGNFGILISRTGIDENCRKYIDRQLQNKVYIIVLTEEDLLKMVESLEQSKDPINIIEEKYKKMIKSIP